MLCRIPRAPRGEGHYNTRMVPQWTPFRWPARWTDPSTLSLLEGTPINFVVFDSGVGLDSVRSRASQMGIAAGNTPAGVTILKGEWPGVQMPGSSAQGAGPTGVPWVDSNGWSIRLAMARDPQSTVWVEFPAKNNAYRL